MSNGISGNMEAPKRIRTSDPRQRRNGRREQGESSFLLSAPEGESTAQPRELRHRLGKKLSEKFSLRLLEGLPEERFQPEGVVEETERVTMHSIHQPGGLFPVQHPEPINVPNPVIPAFAALLNEPFCCKPLGRLLAGHTALGFLGWKIEWAGHEDRQPRPFLPQDLHKERQRGGVLVC